ncbi:rRNA maturation RNase YbeY [Hydrotalea sp.]|uniref:rRNA maturation RNase YbeY n=1 Tax=Hydrotalea sp. TaxID=2881279 RepID=UPI00261B145E|nr:rRNA maturation RNase YbeY [Hydrotalea sp.]
MPAIYFHTADRPFHFPQKKILKAFLGSIFQLENTIGKRVDYIFCSDAHLLEMNRQFLYHDTYTDILTFDLTEDKSTGSVAEIYISTDRVKENAVNHDTIYTEELLRVMIHGILHLCGYKDKTAIEQSMMREKEAIYINAFESLTQ